MTTVHNIKNEKNGNIKYVLEDFKRNENDTMKMYERNQNQTTGTQRNIDSQNKRSTYLKWKKEQAEIIAKHFENISYANATLVLNVLPTPMSKLFTPSEIRKAVRTLKGNKSSGMDQINIELIKYSLAVLHEKIADIYKIIAATRKQPNEITHEIERALKKPGKPGVPTSNLCEQ